MSDDCLENSALAKMILSYFDGELAVGPVLLQKSGCNVILIGILSFSVALLLVPFF